MIYTYDVYIYDLSLVCVCACVCFGGGDLLCVSAAFFVPNRKQTQTHTTHSFFTHSQYITQVILLVYYMFSWCRTANGRMGREGNESGKVQSARQQSVVFVVVFVLRTEQGGTYDCLKVMKRRQ